MATKESGHKEVGTESHKPFMEPDFAIVLEIVAGKSFVGAGYMPGHWRFGLVRHPHGYPYFQFATVYFYKRDRKAPPKRNLIDSFIVPKETKFITPSKENRPYWMEVRSGKLLLVEVYELITKGG